MATLLNSRNVYFDGEPTRLLGLLVLLTSNTSGIINIPNVLPVPVALFILTALATKYTSPVYKWSRRFLTTNIFIDIVGASESTLTVHINSTFAADSVGYLAVEYRVNVEEGLGPLLNPSEATIMLTILRNGLYLAPAPDPIPPPTPVGFAVTASVSYLFVEHSNPTYTQGRGHLKTHIYGLEVEKGAAPSIFLDAKPLINFFGNVCLYPCKPGSTYRIWAKWESYDHMFSEIPAGGTNGIEVTTEYDANELVLAVQGVITDSELYRTLTDVELMENAVGRLRGVLSVNTSAESMLDAQATVADSVYTKVDALTGALAEKVLVLELKYGDNVATLQSKYQTSADALGHVKSEYTLKTVLSANGKTVAGGIGLIGSTNSEGEIAIGFGVAADTFFIAAPDRGDNTGNPQARNPFTVYSTPGVDSNGNTIPAGVYIEGAYIKGGLIHGTTIKNSTIEDSHLINVTASKLTAGVLRSDTYMESLSLTNTGAPKWKIDSGTGVAVFNEAIIRGTMYANQGQIGGITIEPSSIRVGQTGYNTGSQGFYLGADGTFSLGNPSGNNIRWSGSDLYIKGNILGSSGTFSGTLTADAINAVSTINIQNQAVTTTELAQYQIAGIGNNVTYTGSTSHTYSSYMANPGYMYVCAVITFYCSSPTADKTIVNLYINGDHMQGLEGTTTLALGSRTLIGRKEFLALGWYPVTVTSAWENLEPASNLVADIRILVFKGYK